MKYQTLNSSRSTSHERSKMLSKFLPNDSDASQRNQKMENSQLALEIELEITQKALKYQTKRCQDLVEIYMKKLQSKDHEIEIERQLRNRQLSYLLRTLFLFEVQLRHDQCYAKRQLSEKDDIIDSLRKQLVHYQNLADSTTSTSFDDSSCSETSANSDFIYVQNNNGVSISDGNASKVDDDVVIDHKNPFEIFLSTMGLSTKSLITLSPTHHIFQSKHMKLQSDVLNSFDKNSFKFLPEIFL